MFWLIRQTFLNFCYTFSCHIRSQVCDVLWLHYPCQVYSVACVEVVSSPQETRGEWAQKTQLVVFVTTKESIFYAPLAKDIIFTVDCV
jgi:hypothetical protein